MQKFKNLAYTLRISTGAIITIHGLLRIVFLSKYIDFVLNQFSDIVPLETVLTVGAALLPFLEFFVGLLILTKVSIKKSVAIAFFISAFMGVFIVSKDLYPRLLYHCLVVVLLVLVYITSKKPTNTYT